MNGFKKCCISNGMDEIGDGMLWNGSGGVNECEEGKGTDCEDGERDTDW
jgi:hypothetical protein